MAVKKNRIRKDFYRRGPDHRTGLDVTFTEIRKEFGFVTIIIGRWVTKAENQLAANLIYDALHDLAYLLKVPANMLGLRNTLNLAFGTGGMPGAQAHYNPMTKTLHLAKNAGAGALAHEFWHAFDHFIAQKMYPGSPNSAFASKLWLKSGDYIKHPLNDLLSQFFCKSLLSPCQTKPSPLLQRAIEIDGAMKRVYFSQPEEMTARIFESWIQSRNELKNSYLVQGTQQSSTAQLGVYPELSELPELITELALYFEYLGYALKNRS